MNRRFIAFACLALVVATASCVRGDRYVAEAHAAYNEALRTRLDEELLLNLVRLRYRDRPLFLQVSSVIARFNRQHDFSLGGSVNVADPVTGGASVSGLARFAETPTVTFTPLQGEDFAERLLRPIDVETIALLNRSGWSIDRLLRITVQRMNGLDNASGASGPTPAKAPNFEEFIGATRALRELQQRRAVVIGTETSTTVLGAALPAEALTAADVLAAASAGHRFEETDEGAVVLRSTASQFMLRVAASEQQSEATQQLRETLGLATDGTSFELISAVGEVDDLLGAAGERRRVVFVTRSLLGVFFFLCHAVEVPARDVDSGVITATENDDGSAFDWSQVTEGVLRIQWSQTRPQTAAVAVPYRGVWFYIDDADQTSKSTFALLAQLYALQSGDPVGGSAPVPTIPVGG